MKAYHEISPDSLDVVLHKGLIRTSRGDKGDDRAIIATDRFLDARRPLSLKQQGASREHNVYAYFQLDNLIIDIADGSPIPIDKFIARSKHQVLELDIDPQRCFVSDLDAFDALKSAIEANANEPTLEQLAKNYWSTVIRLIDFSPPTVR